MKEEVIQQWVAEYLRIQHPDVLFHSDFGSGTKLTMGQAVKQKKLNGGRRAWPDIFIAQRKLIHENHGWWCGGLFIELKRENTRIHKKNGDFASDHIREQAEMLKQLRERGYMAEFACGFDEAKQLIDNYLGGRNGDIQKK